MGEKQKETTVSLRSIILKKEKKQTDVTYLDIEMCSSVLRLWWTLLLLLLRGRWTLWRWRSLRPEKLCCRVRVRMLQMMSRRGLVMLQVVWRCWCKRCHEMFFAADNVNPGFQQHDATTASTHGQSGGGVLLKFFLTRWWLTAPRCAAAMNEIYKNQLD